MFPVNLLIRPIIIFYLNYVSDTYLLWEIQFRDTSFYVIIMLIKLGHEILCICLMCPNIYINRLH